MTNDECCRGVCAKNVTSDFAARRSKRRNTAFTLIELIVVTTVIVILTGLILSTAGYVQRKGARARAETEIAAMSAACENYKAASQYLYGQLAGDPNFDGVPDPNYKSYMQFKPNTLAADANNKVYPRDPFGNSYGYSTRMAAIGSGGYNPTFDLWSTTGLTSGTDSTQWIKNW